MTDTTQPSAETLEPCPFCGGRAQLMGANAPEFWVSCLRIGCKASTEGFGSKNRAIAAWNMRTVMTRRAGGDAGCKAAPDHADIMETIQNAADDWQKKGYPTALAEVRDMANVGRALMEALPEGYCYMNCPSEIVSDLQNELDEAVARAGGDAGAVGEVEAFRRGAEAMQRKFADALRDHLNSRAAAIANGVTIPEYQA